jgi:hypothetical protein
MKTGSLVRVTGAEEFTGRVLIATEDAMIVTCGQDLSVTLRRNPSSTSPDQWRYGCLPMKVEEE